MNSTKITLLFLIAFCLGCSSGKKAYDRGDYYDAVVKAVTRLKQKPDHDKSKETLKSAYPLAIQNLESQANSLLESDAAFKYKNSIQIYQRINQLGDVVKSAPAAMAVIKQPKMYHDKIGTLKEKAAEELYEAGIQSMMKGTRPDSRQAYFYFKECEEYRPKYKEALEMMTKAEEDGTLKVLYEESAFENWTNAASVIRNLDNLQFIALYNKTMAVNTLEQRNTMNLNMLISIKDYTEERAQFKKKEFERLDSVKTGEKVVKNVKVPVYQKVKGRFTSVEGTARSVGRASVIIRDNQNGNIVLTQDFEGVGRWSDTWGLCSGDQRALDKNDKKLCEKGEQKPNLTNMKNMAKEDLEKQMYSTLASFLKDY